MSAPRELATRQYSQVRSLTARGMMSRAAGPCEVDESHQPAEAALRRGTGFVYEHCHRHDYIRGVTCQSCNGQMKLIDRHVDVATLPGFSRYVDWWGRCPACASGPAWEPWLTIIEYLDEPVVTRLRELGRTDPKSPAGATLLAVLDAHGRELIERQELAARMAAALAARQGLRAASGT